MSPNQAYRVLHLTTVHDRTDTRIARREVETLQRSYPGNIGLVVADGQGNGGGLGKAAEIIDVGRPLGGRLGRMILGCWRVFRVVQAARPHLVHFHDPELIAVGIACKLTGIRVIYDAHEDLPAQVRYKYWLPRVVRVPVARVVGAVERLGVWGFDCVVTATPAIARRFPESKVTVVQNFPPAPDGMATDEVPYCIRDHSFVYIGSLDAIRGAREMIEALERLEALASVLHIAGRIRPESLKSELELRNGWKQIRFHGWVDQVEAKSLLGKARAGLVLFHPYPNHEEAQPNKLFEYMASGLPVIASDFPMWRNIIEEAGCGLLVDPLDPKMIADAMQWILENREEAEVMGQNGRQAVESRYNWEQESEKLLKLYEKLLCEAV